MKRYLLLEDGNVFEGEAFGASVDVSGELIFTTSPTGYLEVLTDPSYGGQIVLFAFPSVLTYNLRRSIPQSREVSASGVIVRETAGLNSEAFHELDMLLNNSGVPGIKGVDTRKIIELIRKKGNMRGIMSSSRIPEIDFGTMNTRDLLRRFSTTLDYHMNNTTNDEILFVDMGTKKSLLDQVAKISSIHVVPFDFPFHTINGGYSGIFLSNGPGDPSDDSLNGVRDLIRRNYGKLPIFGVCLGHQVLSIALGASTGKMLYGHHGTNHSVIQGDRCYITSHNHNFHVLEESLFGTPLEVIQRDANDGAVEMVSDSEKYAVSVQYHPEGAPGPRDPCNFFGEMQQAFGGVYARNAWNK